MSSSAIKVNPASDVTGSPLKLTTTGHDFTGSNMNSSGIQSFLFGVILQTAGIVVQYRFWQFLTSISSSFVRNPGKEEWWREGCDTNSVFRTINREHEIELLCDDKLIGI
ncbi:hypothetical protein [Nostoc sp.]